MYCCKYFIVLLIATQALSWTVLTPRLRIVRRYGVFRDDEDSPFTNSANKVGKIYEFVGKANNGEPPQELVELLGLKSRDITVNSRMGTRKQSSATTVNKQTASSTVNKVPPKWPAEAALQASKVSVGKTNPWPGINSNRKSPVLLAHTDPSVSFPKPVFHKEVHVRLPAVKTPKKDRYPNEKERRRARQAARAGLPLEVEEETEEVLERRIEEAEERLFHKLGISQTMRAKMAAKVANSSCVVDTRPRRERRATFNKKHIPLERENSEQRRVEEVMPSSNRLRGPDNALRGPDNARTRLLRKLDPEPEEDVDSEPEPAEIRSGPMQALSGFRLRPPPPPDPAQVALDAAKERLRAEKDRAFEEKRALLKKQRHKQFEPFYFEADDDGYRSHEDAVDDTELFTTGNFQELGISDPTVLSNLKQMQILSPTQIQAAGMPAMMRGENVVLQAQTGSGKTLAYLLPLLKVVDPTKKQVQAIVLAPSRELVQQIGQVASTLFKDTNYRTFTLIGGANVNHQVNHLRDHRPQILIATPGRIAEIVFKLEKLRLGSVKVVVVDEVDSLMSEPYIGEVDTLLQATPLYSRASSSTPKQQDELRPADAGEPIAPISDSPHQAEGEAVGVGDTPTCSPTAAAPGAQSMQRLLWLASATSKDAAVGAFADRYTARSGKGWSEITVTGGSALPAGITHGLISITRERAPEMLKRVLTSKPAVRSALIFVNDPRRVEAVCRDLERSGIVSAPLHGEASKDDRREIIARIKDGRLKYVVTTELAARGLDIPELSHVINYELPTDAPHYVHRTGRCGRAGRKGLVINFANPETKFVIRRFGKKLGVDIHDCEIRDSRVYLKYDN